MSVVSTNGLQRQKKNQEFVQNAKARIGTDPVKNRINNSSPIISTKSGKVLIGSNAGEAGGIGILYCLDEETGELYWNFTTAGDIHGTALLANELVYIGSLDEKMYCLGYLEDGGNGGNGQQNNKNKTKIMVTMKISTNEVLSGHAIENIIVTAKTENGTPIPQTWVVFELEPKLGALSDYYGTVFQNGTYIFSYIAPTVGKIRYVNLTATASKFGYENGTNFTTIMIKPLDNKDNGKSDDDDDLLTEMVKPKYYFLWIIITVLIIMTLLIFGLLMTIRKKLKNLETGNSSIQKDQEQEVSKHSKVKQKSKDSNKDLQRDRAKQSKTSTKVSKVPEERVPPP